jgi:DNA-binding transcriptional regulator YiaG
MPNIATVLKSEIARVARKEVRGETQALKRATAQYRRDIAALKRRVHALEGLVKRVGKTAGKAGAPVPDEASGKAPRFSAKGLAAQRRRFGLSGQAFGALIGVTGQSVYKWEDGKTRPRAKQLQAIASLRAMGKRDAAVRLSERAS